MQSIRDIPTAHKLALMRVFTTGVDGWFSDAYAKHNMYTLILQFTNVMLASFGNKNRTIDLPTFESQFKEHDLLLRLGRTPTLDDKVRAMINRLTAK